MGRLIDYKNNYGWCRYPYMPGPLGYCWGYAAGVDEGKTKEEQYKSCTAKDENGKYYCEFYKGLDDKGKHQKG